MDLQHKGHSQWNERGCSKMLRMWQEKDYHEYEEAKVKVLPLRNKALGGKKEELALLECTLAKRKERWKEEYHFKVILNEAATTRPLIISL